jgi:hypothetical protein
MCLGILLLPACLATLRALWLVLTQTGASAATHIWLPLLAGAASWLAVFLLLPKPMWIYVVGHESTHAVWTWLFGGKVKRFKASSSGGHVVTDRSNFLITLAPYFFPFYAVVVVVIFVIGNLIWHWQPYLGLFHLLLGAAYAFHVTLTVEILRFRQTDITSQGYIFSAVVIFLGNALVLLAAIPLLTGHGLYYAMRCWCDCNYEMMQRVAHLL